jgi:5-hydroxyisourate hydrolase
MTAGKLTTHVLNTAAGCPGAGIRVDLVRIDGTARHQMLTTVTNADGRTDQPLLAAEQFQPGEYELTFHIGKYFETKSTTDQPFLDQIPIRFGIADAGQHYHVPLLVSPFSYATYRGS